MGGTQLGSRWDTGEWAYSAEDMGQRLGGTFADSLLTFGLTNLPAAAHNISKNYSALAAAGEARLLAGEMPTADQLRAMGMSESEARGLLAVLGMEDESDLLSIPPYTGKISESAVESFDKEHLAKQATDLLPNYKLARIPDKKLTGYALNPTHPSGRYKAVAFKKALGYSADNRDLLLLQVYQGLEKYRATERESTAYGRPFEVSMMILGANGRYAKIKTAWMIDTDTSEPRLVSIYVDE